MEVVIPVLLRATEDRPFFVRDKPLDYDVLWRDICARAKDRSRPQRNQFR